MKLGPHLFKKNQSIWGRPMIEYDQTKMSALFSEIDRVEHSAKETILRDTRGPGISLETELYLMLHS